MRIEDERRLRDAFVRATRPAGGGADCVSAADLWASAREELPPEANERVILHTAGCGACAAAWRLARQWEAEVRSLPSARTARRPWLAAGLAAAAMIVMALVAVLLRPAGPPAAPSFRAPQADWLRPALPSAPLSRQDAVLRWTPGPQGTTYDVRVTTEDLEPLGGARRLAEPRYRLDPARLAALPEGDSLLWQVTAHLPDGRKAESPTFTTPVR